MSNEKLKIELEEQIEWKNKAYTERMELVAFLSRLHESHLCRHPEDDESWDKEWMWIVCIHTPAGQMTWHMHDDHIEMFGHMAQKSLNVGDDNHWDGHTTEEKYERLRLLGQMKNTPYKTV